NALDRANAEDALLPIPKVFDSHEKEEAFQNSLGKDVMDDLLTSGSADSMEIDGTYKLYHFFLLLSIVV
ncbi:WD40 repeat-containing protein SMU1, partial [Trifolium medium]|nr:WD40 repeat-containing protein SMU1 [Trifolium medium]